MISEFLRSQRFDLRVHALPGVILRTKAISVMRFLTWYKVYA